MTRCSAPSPPEVRVRLEPEAPVAGCPLTVVLEVENPTGKAIAEAAVDLDVVGDVAWKTKARADLGEIHPGGVFEVAFHLVPRAPGTLHLFASAGVVGSNRLVRRQVVVGEAPSSSPRRSPAR